MCCLCRVVIYLSKDYARLITMLKSCDGKYLVISRLTATVKLQNALKNFSKAGAVSEETSKPVITLMFIAALLAESCDFDNVRKEHDGEYIPRWLVGDQPFRLARRHQQHQLGVYCISGVFC